MAKNKKRRAEGNNKAPQFGVTEASIRQLQSVLTQPDVWGYMQSGALSGVRGKLLKLNYDTIRNVVDRVPIISAIIQTRVDQVLEFSRPASEKNEKGFTIKRADNAELTKKDAAAVKQLTQFFEQTGFNFDPEREDDFADYLGMFIRETMTLDQVATEVQRNRKGDAIAFWLLDGATIKRADPDINPALGRSTRFVQEIEGKIYNQYKADDLLFDYKNKRADIRYRGFGYSAVEMCIDVITTLLFGYNYVRDQLVRDRVPKGFISIMGDAGPAQIESIRRYWYSAMSGAGGQWNLPILPSGKEGVGIDFKNIGQSNRDMEYHKLMMFLSSIAGAVFSIDMSELGIKTDDSSALIGNDDAARNEASKNRGLNALLSFVEQHCNKLLRKVTDEYVFAFSGLQLDDEKAKAEIDDILLRTRKTVNELRLAAGDQPLKDAYADVVLNDKAIQIYMADKMQQGGGDGGMPGGEGDQGAIGQDEDGSGDEDTGGDTGVDAAGEDEGDGGSGDVDWASMFKSQTGSKRTVRLTIE